MSATIFIDKFQKEIGVFMLIGCGFLPLAIVSVIIDSLRSLIYNGYGYIAFVVSAYLLLKVATETTVKLYSFYSNLGGAMLQKELRRLRSENEELKTSLVQAESTIEKLHHLAIEKEKETARADSWVMLNELLKSGFLMDKSGKVIQIAEPSRGEYARQIRMNALSNGQLVKWKAKNNASMVQVSWFLENGYRVTQGFESLYQNDENEGFRPFVGGV